MKIVTTAIVISTLIAGPAVAGNSSSNSSSNSSNGVHTRVDTITTDNGRGRSSYVERRYYSDERERKIRDPRRYRR